MHTLTRIRFIKALFVCFGIALGFIGLELCTPITFRLLVHRPFEKEEIVGRLISGDSRAIAQVHGAADSLLDKVMKGAVLHPYVGFTLDPTVAGINRYGYWGKAPFYSSSEDSFVIGIFGGSVAYDFFFQGRDELEKRLRDAGINRGKTFKFVNMAIGGYKQPQQLAAFEYMLALGAHFDVVLNIDGFNEVVLPVMDNAPFGVSPSYPRHWYALAQHFLSEDQLHYLVENELSRQRRETLKGIFSNQLLIKSNFALALWEILDSDILSREFDHRVRGEKSNVTSALGPNYDYSDIQRRVNDLVRIWMESSRSMHAAANARGIGYYHILQPNQYYEGSKPLTEKERSTCIVENPPIFRDTVRSAYGKLREGGESLRSEGISFLDATLVFKDLKETLYVDNCCHFNKKGHEVLAAEISERISNN